MNMFTRVLFIITRGWGGGGWGTQQSLIREGSAPKLFFVEKALPLSYTFY